MISSLLSRELEYYNILWVPSDNTYYEKFIHNLGINLFSLDSIYFGHCVPNIIVSNNKMNHLDTIIDLCHYHHCGLIIVDHEIKSDMIDTKKFIEKISSLPNVKQIALSNAIKKSWDDIHDLILNYNSEEDQQEWLSVFKEVKNQKFIYESNTSIQ